MSVEFVIEDGLRIFDIELVAVEFGKVGSKNRIKKVERGLASEFGPDYSCFFRINEWLEEGRIEERLLLVQFLDQVFPSTHRVIANLRRQGYQLKGYPQLCAAMLRRSLVDQLAGEGILWVQATDIKSFVRFGDDDGPYFDCRSGYHRLSSCIACAPRDQQTAWLVGPISDPDQTADKDKTPA